MDSGNTEYFPCKEYIRELEEQLEGLEQLLRAQAEEARLRNNDEAAAFSTFSDHILNYNIRADSNHEWPWIEVLRLFKFAMEEAGETYPLFTPAYVKILMDHVMDCTQDNAAERPSQLAISSCLAAISMQWKAENSSLTQLSGMMWSHFKNAFSTFPFLITQGSSVYSFHALLLMVVFLQGCAEVRVAAQITAAAIRVAQMVGIPCRSQGSILAELNLRAFWTLRMLFYLLSMVILLLSDILRDPKDPSAKQSVLAIEECLNYLRRMKQDLQGGMKNILDGCTKMHDIARCVVFVDPALSDSRKGRSDDEELQKVSTSSSPISSSANAFASNPIVRYSPLVRTFCHLPND
ncbi:hypothetical protein G7Z17_g1945 [Cylindrodendrum hubeiense]|uniref:Transcription factor domain-containing protein n=1 Tax=Cylindrodendrum hubeiense TaxID=595255 RepID=A0A9P5LC11_9HYPO|nr:hypothetical protein G7Z17_g1945 [Cylindrodendrum hubeiense]